MAELNWRPRSPLEAALVPGAHGAAGSAGVSLTELRNFRLVQVMARRGQWPELARRSEAGLGAPCPGTPATVAIPGGLLIWSGPHQFFVLSDGSSRYGLEALDGIFAGTASLSDQSDARALIQLRGPQAPATLAKLCSVDLHPASFPPGTAAATSIDHTNVTLWRERDEQGGGAVFRLLVFSSFAGSLWHAMLLAAGEYGASVSFEDFYPSS